MSVEINERRAQNLSTDCDFQQQIVAQFAHNEFRSARSGCTIVAYYLMRPFLRASSHVESTYPASNRKEIRDK